MPRSIDPAVGARPPGIRAPGTRAPGTLANRERCAVGYLRRSTDRQEQSIPDQKRAVEQFAEEQGLTLLRCYVDDAISGTSTVGRKAFQQLIEDAQSPKRDFATAVVYDVKRFGRVDNDEAGYYRHILKQHGVEVLYASEGFAGDGTDDLLRPVKQWQARQESKDLSKVVIRGLLSKNGDNGPRDDGNDAGGGGGGHSGGGWWMGGAPPFGYDLRYESRAGHFLLVLRYMPDGSKQALNTEGAVMRTLERGETIAVSKRDRCRLALSAPDRVDVVRSIFRGYVEDVRGFKTIADMLNAAKVPTPRGPAWLERYSGRWAIGTVRAILCNPAYVGDMVWNRRTDARFHRIAQGRAVERRGVVGRRLEANDEADWIVIPGAHPEIISRRTWEQAKSLLLSKPSSARQRGVNPRVTPSISVAYPVESHRAAGGGLQPTGPKAKFLLSGLVDCARCGCRYEGRTRYGRKLRPDGSKSRSFEYACGGYVRHGRSVCTVGSIAQSALEETVIGALLAHYEQFRGDTASERIAGALDVQIGVEQSEVAKAQKRIAARLARVDETSRRLLDNVSAANREHVDRRLGELDEERHGLNEEKARLDRAALSEAEAQSLIDAIRHSIEVLEPTLRSAGHAERQAALRRCVEAITLDVHDSPQRAVLRLRTLPRVVNGPDVSPVIEVGVELEGRRIGRDQRPAGA